MKMDEKSSDQRGFSDVTFHFPPIATAGIRLGGDSCPDIVQLNYQEVDTNVDGTSSCINDNDLDYDAFFSQYIDVDNNDQQEEKCVINLNLCGDQIFSQYIDVDNNDQQEEKCVFNLNLCGDQIRNGDSSNDEDKVVRLDRTQCCPNETPKAPPLSKHHAPDSSQNLEAKKAMSAAKLAELWIVDPKRAKRIMANRQSAARSKERKARYISELERKVKSLQTEATALATQLTVYKEDAAHLAAENKELKLRLQTMEHQAQSQDEIAEAMMGEVERLRFTTGEIVPSSSLKLGMQSQVHHHLLPLPCSTPAAADRQYSFQGLSCHPTMSHYWPSLHQQ